MESGARFSKLPVITGPVKLLFSIKDGSFKSFEIYTVKLSAKETKWPSSEVRTHPTVLKTLILTVLSRTGPLYIILRNYWLDNWNGFLLSSGKMARHMQISCEVYMK